MQHYAKIQTNGKCIRKWFCRNNPYPSLLGGWLSHCAGLASLYLLLECHFSDHG